MTASAATLFNRSHVSPMIIRGQEVNSGSRQTVTLIDDASLLVIAGAGNCSLEIDGHVAGIWIPLCGRLRVVSGTTEYPVRANELRVTEFDMQVSATADISAPWLAVLGGKKVWRTALAATQEFPYGPMMLPTLYAIDPVLMQRAIALFKAVAVKSLNTETLSVVERVLALQSGFADAIARCPGRTYTKRQQVFLRLQRVRNYLGANCQLDLDNGALARMANYSPCHFLRTFHSVYRETPHQYLVNQRLQRAVHLLRTSRLAIVEVALMSGFENRSAFSRSFHQRFGTTACTARELGRTFA